MLKFNNDLKVCLVEDCGEKIKAPGTNRTNLMHHLKEKHKIELKGQLSSNQPTIKKFQADPLISKKFEIVLAKQVCLDFVSPYAIYRKESFKALYLKAYNQIVTEEKLWRAVDYMYDLLKSCVLKEINDSIQKPTITLDDWGCRNGREYCNINVYVTKSKTVMNDDVEEEVHFVKKLSLSLAEIPKTDSASLSIGIKDKLAEFKVNPLFITTDGASNMTRMAKLSGFEQQQCYLHAINLFVVDLVYKKSEFLDAELDCEESDELNEDLDDEFEPSDEIECSEEISDIISSVRKMMTRLARSKNLRYVLRKFSELSPINDVQTRWNSMCLMLERALELLTPLRQASLVSKEIKLISEFFTDGVKAKIERLLKILTPVKDAVTELSAEDNNLLSADIILTKCYREFIGISSDVAQRFYDRIKARRKPWSNILAFFIGDISKNDFYDAPEDSEIVNLYEKIKSCPQNGNKSKVASNNFSDVEAAKRAKYSVSSSTDVEIELESFRLSRVIGPKIDVLLKSLLAIKPTSIDSERAFSICRSFMHFNRLRTSSLKLDKMLFNNQNYKVCINES